MRPGGDQEAAQDPDRRAAGQGRGGARAGRRLTWRRSSRAGSGGPSGRASASPTRTSPRSSRPASRRATRPTSCRRRRHDRQDPRRAHGHQGAASSDANGLQQWKPGPQGRVPDRRRRTVARDVGRRCGSRRRPSPATPTRPTQLVARAGRRRARRARRRGPQAPRPLRDRRLHVRGHRRRRRRLGRRGRSPSSRRTRRPVADAVRVARASRDYVNTAYPPGLAALLDGVPPRYAVIDVGTNSIKFHVARARRTARGADPRRPRRAHPPGRGAGGERRDTPDAARRGRVTRSPAWSRRRRRRSAVAIAAVGTAGLRIASNRDDVVDAIAAARPASTIEVISGRGGEPARVPRGPAGLGLPDGVAGGVRHRRRQHPAHVRPRRPRSTSGSAWTSARCATRSGSGSTAPSRRRSLAEALAAIARRPVAARRPRPGRRAGRHGRGGHQHHRRRRTAWRPTTRTSSRARVLERAEIDRQIELYRTRDAAERRAIVGPPAQARGSDPGRGVHRAHRDGQARRRPADRQRPWAPARRPRRTVRRHPDRNGGIDVSPRSEDGGSRQADARRQPPRRRRRPSAACPTSRCSRVLRLIRGADSVELKVTVPAESHRATIQGLAARPRRGPAAAGLLLRHAGPGPQQGGPRRPGAPDPGRPRRHRDQAPPGRARRPARELRARTPTSTSRSTCCRAASSARRRSRAGRRATRSATPSPAPSRSAGCSPRRQRAFYQEHAPAGIELDDLIPLGPTFMLKAPVRRAAGRRRSATVRRLVAEMWLYPDGSRILELSTKCLPDEAFKVAAETRAYLLERGVDLERRPADQDEDRARVLRRPASRRPEADGRALA